MERGEACQAARIWPRGATLDVVRDAADGARHPFFVAEDAAAAKTTGAEEALRPEDVVCENSGVTGAEIPTRHVEGALAFVVGADDEVFIGLIHLAKADRA